MLSTQTDGGAAMGSTETKTDHQLRILAAMMSPGFYPHPVTSIKRLETHISTVFLTGRWVYKIKKPVDLGFLNFSTLEKRRHYCRQEVILNRRLSRGIYIDTVPITHRDGAYTLGGSGPTVEFAVKMKQLAETDSMGAHLTRSTLDDEDVEGLVHLLVDFYRQASTDDPADAVAPPAWEENLNRVGAFAGVWIDRRQFEAVRSATQAFFKQQHRLFLRRIKGGKIKDCHGDLRTDHIYFTPNGVQIIDCIEFNRRFRYQDIISDLAFLAMDLEYHRFPQTARSLIRLYVEQTDDVEALPLLDFYRCYRAMVRCKVSCLRLKETGRRDAGPDPLRTSAERYLAMAQGYADAFSRPTLWMVCGLPASGKSTLAKMLAAVLDINLIRSDVIRKALFADAGTPPGGSAFEQGRYSTYATEVTYERMMALAREDLEKGQSVVIDATFSRTEQRNHALRMATCRQARPVFVECRAAEPILAERLLERETRPSVSDARLVHLKAFKARFEPIIRVGKALHMLVDTQTPPATCLRQILLTAIL